MASTDYFPLSPGAVAGARDYPENKVLVLSTAYTVASVREFYLRDSVEFLSDAEFRGAPETLAPLVLFLQAMGMGVAEVFRYFTWDTAHPWANVTIGSGNGSTRLFTAPGITASMSLSVAGVVKTKGVDYGFGIENKVVSSEVGTDVSWIAYAGAIKTITANQTDPGGGTTAWRAQTSGGSSGLKLYTSMGVNAVGKRAKLRLYVKNNTASAVTIGMGHPGVIAMLPASAGWTLVEIEGDVTNAGGDMQVRFLTTGSGVNLDVTLWQPCGMVTNANIGNPDGWLSWGYIPTDGAAVPSTAYGQTQVRFYSGKTPGSGAAIVAPMLIGRRMALGRLRQPFDCSSVDGRIARLRVQAQGVPY